MQIGRVSSAYFRWRRPSKTLTKFPWQNL